MVTTPGVLDPADPGARSLQLLLQTWCGSAPRRDHPQMVTTPGVLDPADPGARSLQLLLQTWCGSAPRRGPSANGYDAWRFGSESDFCGINGRWKGHIFRHNRVLVQNQGTVLKKSSHRGVHPGPFPSREGENERRPISCAHSSWIKRSTLLCRKMTWVHPVVSFPLIFSEYYASVVSFYTEITSYVFLPDAVSYLVATDWILPSACVRIQSIDQMVTIMFSRPVIKWGYGCQSCL